MENDDLYSEAHMCYPYSGEGFDKAINRMEESFCEDGHRLPRYSYGPEYSPVKKEAGNLVLSY